MSTYEAASPEGSDLAGLLTVEFVRLVKQYTGRGPSKAYTLLGKDCLVSFFGQSMTETERALAEHGQADFASQIREVIHATMRPEIEDAVERLTGRRVLAVLADHSAEPDVGLLACVLEPGEPIVRDS